MNYRQIQPLAWRINPDLHELRLTYEEMKFPTNWGEKLRRLIADAQKRDPDKTSLPISDLNKALRALVPDLISIEKKASSANSMTWLRSTERSITPEALRLIMYWWAIFSSKAQSGNLIEDVVEQLTADRLVWTTQQLDLARWSTHANNTAKAADAAIYNVIPDLVSSRLSANGVEFDLHGRRLRFYRVPISPGASGTELISWPPIDLAIGKATYYFSVLATVTLQTIPFQPFPEIYIDLGIRRWVSGRTEIPRRDATSVYLRTAVPWITGIRQSDCFQVAQVRWRRDGRGLEWASQLAKILNQIAPERPLPDPQTIAADPVPAMNIDAIPNTAIVYREAMRQKHRITAGIMPADRVPLASQIADVLAPDFVRLGSLPLVARPKMHKNIFTTKPTEQTLTERRQSLAALTDSALSLNVYYQMDDTRDAFITEISQILGVPTPQSLPAVFEVDGLAVEINAQQTGAIGAGLEIGARRGHQVEAYRAAVEQRIDLISRQVPHATKPALAFVEIEGADQYEQRSGEADPKRAIRNGLAKAGYLSQFIVLDPEHPVKERAKRALLDGLRQLGIHRGLATGALLPKQWNCAGIWLIYQSKKTSFSGTQQYIPVAVSISAQNGRAYATAPGIGGWLPYPDALLRIAQGNIRRYERPAQALTFIRQFVCDEVSADGDVLLLCDSQNLRKAWAWLRDTDIYPDTLSFGADVPIPIADHPGLRLVRVRGDANHETPEWYAHNDTNEGFSAGLFRISERVFASTHSKPSPFKKTAVKASILDRPKMVAWNPVLYELTVAAMQPGDDPAKIAEYAHSLRLAAVQYDDATALPLPLHLAKLMEEYVLTVDSEDEEGEDSD